MSEKEFDKLLKKSMDTTRDIPFSEDAWGDMEARMSGKRKRKFPFAWWMVMVPLLLGSLGLNVWLGHRLTQSNTELSVRNSSISSSLKNDTIEKTITIYKTDTINLTTTPTIRTTSQPSTPFDNSISNAISNSTATTERSNINVNPIILNTSNPEPNTQTQVPKIIAEPSLELEPKQTTTKPAKKETKPIAKLHISPEFNTIYNQEHDVKFEVLTNDNLNKKSALPRYWRIGLTTGAYTGRSSSLDRAVGAMAGITGEIHLVDNFTLATGYEYLNFDTDFSATSKAVTNTNDVLNDYGTSVDSIIAAPGSGTSISNVAIEDVQSTFRFAQIPIRIHYNFKNKSSWQPYLGGGVIAVKPLSGFIDLDLNSFSASSPEVFRSLDLAASIDNGYSINTVQGLIGVRYNLNARWRVHLQGDIMHHRRENIYQTEQRWMYGLEGGVSYQFGFK